VATANSIKHLPPELMRKGRFDEIFFVDLPKPKERAAILKIHLTKRKRNPAKYDLAQLSGKCEGFSGAEIEQAIISAMFDSFDERRELATGDILETMASSVPLSVTMQEDLGHLRSWATDRARPASS